MANAIILNKDGDQIGKTVIAYNDANKNKELDKNELTDEMIKQIPAEVFKDADSVSLGDADGESEVSVTKEQWEKLQQGKGSEAKPADGKAKAGAKAGATLSVGAGGAAAAGTAGASAKPAGGKKPPVRKVEKVPPAAPVPVAKDGGGKYGDGHWGGDVEAGFVGMIGKNDGLGGHVYPGFLYRGAPNSPLRLKGGLDILFMKMSDPANKDLSEAEVFGTYGDDPLLRNVGRTGGNLNSAQRVTDVSTGYGFIPKFSLTYDVGDSPVRVGAGAGIGYFHNPANRTDRIKLTSGTGTDQANPCRPFDAACDPTTGSGTIPAPSTPTELDKKAGSPNLGGVTAVLDGLFQLHLGEDQNGYIGLRPGAIFIDGQPSFIGSVNAGGAWGDASTPRHDPKKPPNSAEVELMAQQDGTTKVHIRVLRPDAYDPAMAEGQRAKVGDTVTFRMGGAKQWPADARLVNTKTGTIVRLAPKDPKVLQYTLVDADVPKDKETTILQVRNSKNEVLSAIAIGVEKKPDVKPEPESHAPGSVVTIEGPYPAGTTVEVCGKPVEVDVKPNVSISFTLPADLEVGTECEIKICTPDGKCESRIFKISDPEEADNEGNSKIGKFSSVNKVVEEGKKNVIVAKLNPKEDLVIKKGTPYKITVNDEIVKEAKIDKDYKHGEPITFIVDHSKKMVDSLTNSQGELGIGDLTIEIMGVARSQEVSVAPPIPVLEGGVVLSPDNSFKYKNDQLEIKFTNIKGKGQIKFSLAGTGIGKIQKVEVTKTIPADVQGGNKITFLAGRIAKTLKVGTRFKTRVVYTPMSADGKKSGPPVTIEKEIMIRGKYVGGGNINNNITKLP